MFVNPEYACMSAMLLAGGPAAPQASPMCTLCPVGTFSPGGNREPCRPCSFGKTSAPGAIGEAACVDSPTACPPGQIAPPTAVSSSECSCLAGFGWTGSAATGSCQICPVGTFGTGVGRQPCQTCGFGSTSPKGSDDPGDCYPVDQCPVGMWVDPAGPSNPPSSAEECVCKPGYGGGCLSNRLLRRAATISIQVEWHTAYFCCQLLTLVLCSLHNWC